MSLLLGSTTAMRERRGGRAAARAARELTAVPHRKQRRPTTRCTGARWRLTHLLGAREGLWSALGVLLPQRRKDRPVHAEADREHEGPEDRGLPRAHIRSKCPDEHC